MITRNLEEFGEDGIYQLSFILEQWYYHGLPNDFNPKEVSAMFDDKTGKAFVTNIDSQKLMMNGDESIGVYYTLNSVRGFLDDLVKYLKDDLISDPRDIIEIEKLIILNNKIKCNRN